MASALLLAGFGCSPTEQLAEMAVENSINAELGGEANVDVRGNTIRFEDEATGTVSAWGEGVEIPSNFPSDVPLYSGATIMGVTVSEQEGDAGSWLSFTTKDTLAVVIEWYSATLLTDGWTSQGSYSVQGTEMRIFNKGDITLTVSAAASAAVEGTTSVTIVRAEK